MLRKAAIISAMIIFAVLQAKCSGGGGGSGGGGASVASQVTGTIASQTSNTGDFEGWVMLLVNKETGESRFSEISSSGSYAFNQVDMSAVYTLVLLNIDYRVASVLSWIAADQDNEVYQYFTLKSSVIPRVIHKGPSMELSDLTAVTVSTATGKDSDGDGIVNGMETDTSLYFGLADEDSDNIDNEDDTDIDGDGLLNWFDSDDDGNGTIDVFDSDANSDLVADSNQTNSDHYFGTDVEYIAVQYFIDSDSNRSIRMVAKLGESFSPTAVTIKGPEDLFDESTILTPAEGGDEEGGLWDNTLSDDGSSYDDSASDKLYGKKVKLKTGKYPKADQVILVSVDMGSYTREFPFTFPDVTAGSISFAYSSRVITKSGSPFGSDETSYNWSASIYNSDGNLVHASASVDGETSTYTVPAADVPSGTTYKGKIFAKSYERVSGYPVYVVESALKTLD